MPRWLKALIVGTLTGLAGALFALTPYGQDFEKYVGLKYLFKFRGAIEAPRDVAVVAIDSDTGRHLELSRLPRDWSREVHARLVGKLVELGASVIVFDLDLQRPKSFEEDSTFANAIASADRVVLYEKLEGKMQPIIGAIGGAVGKQWVEQSEGPTEVLADAAKGIGSFPLPKLDVAVYDFWTFKPSAGNAPTIPSLALQIRALNAHDEWLGNLRDAGAKDVDKLPPTAAEIVGAPETEKVMQIQRRMFERNPPLANTVIERLGRRANGDGRPSILLALAKLYAGPADRYINFYGPPGSIRTIPYRAVLNSGSEANAEVPDLRNTVVFVGYSDLYDPGQPDRFYTVFTREDGVDLSGVEIMATAFANLITDRALRPTDTVQTVVVLVVFGLVMVVLAYLFPAMVGVPLAILLAAGYAAAAQTAFSTRDMWFPVAIPLLGQLPVALFVGLIGQYLFERRQKQLVTEAIGYYLPENVAKSLTAGVDVGTINQVVYSTCLATDMAGFSTIAEQMEPKALAKFMNDYFDTLAAPLKRHGVDVTEFRADAIMCAWTAPEPTDSVRRRAAYAGLEAVEAIVEFSRRHAPLTLKARIGLETGMTYIGHAGGGGKFVYSIVGDCANAAARIESLNKQLKTSVLASETVLEGIDDLQLRPLGRFVFVGKTQPTRLNEIIARTSAATQAQKDFCDRFAEAMHAFETADWVKASTLLESLLAAYPEDGPSQFLLARCRRYLTEPPATDDPSVIHLETK
jgi:adenylate cyclase